MTVEATKTTKTTKELKKRYPENPLITPREIVLKERVIKVGSARELVDTSSGEITNINAIYQRKFVDTEKFAKIYLDGVGRTFGLSKTALRVFQIILQVCQRDTDRIYLNFMVCSKIDSRMQERTYHRGLLELLKAGFVAYSDLPNMFWINPHLFFNGDRVRFITEYVRRREEEWRRIAAPAKQPEPARDPNTIDLIDGLTDAERNVT